MKTISSNKELAKAIIDKHGFKCFYCKKDLTEFEEYGFDHVLARSAGGKDTLDNLVPACKSCNGSKYNYSVSTWAIRLVEKRNKAQKIVNACNRILQTIREEDLLEN